MTRYLVTALVVSIVSVVISVCILCGLYGFNPLHLSIVSKAKEATTVADQAAVASAVATVSLSISTVFALIVGTIAVIAVLIVARAETKSIEQLKIDFVSLCGILISIRNRALSYSAMNGIDEQIDIFQAEREGISTIMNSPTGFAIYAWSGRPNNKAFSLLFAEINKLSNLTTRNRRDHFGSVMNVLFRNSSELLRKLVSIEVKQFKEINQFLSNLGKGLSQVRDSLKEDSFNDLEKRTAKKQDEVYRAPTEQEISSLKEMAQQKIGEKSAETIEHFARAAVNGSAHDKAIFHSLIKQLLGINLEDIPKTDS